MKNHPTSIAERIRSWIQSITDEKNWTGTDLARNAQLSPSTVLRILNDPNGSFLASHKTLQKIAAAAGTTIPADILVDLGDPEPTQRPSPAFRTAPADIPVRRLTKLPVRHGETFVRAPFIDGIDASVFAFRVPDEGLAPFVRPGSLAFATSDREPAFNDIVLVVTHDGRALLRLMKGSEGQHLQLGTSTGEEAIDVVDVTDVAVVILTSHG